ncbi:MAG TPA: hypothetical protein VNV66_16520 [Pilimelia sp.]|nr:hypothetical protein [Pilimelia sp.]
MNPATSSAASRPAATSTGGAGEVFTRPWVVDLVLDLADYRPERDLTELRLVEPACGRERS